MFTVLLWWAFERLVAADERGVRAGRASLAGLLFGPRRPDARDGALLPARRGALARLAARRAGGRAGRALRGGRAPRGPALDRAQPVVFGAFVPVSTVGRPQSLAGQRPPVPAGGVRASTGRCTAGSRSTARAAEGDRGGPRAAAAGGSSRSCATRCPSTGPRTASPIVHLERGAYGDVPRAVRPRRDRGRARALPGRARALRRGRRRAAARPRRLPAAGLPRLLRAAARGERTATRATACRRCPCSSSWAAQGWACWRARPRAVVDRAHLLAAGARRPSCSPLSVGPSLVKWVSGPGRPPWSDGRRPRSRRPPTPGRGRAAREALPGDPARSPPGDRRARCPSGSRRCARP